MAQRQTSTCTVYISSEGQSNKTDFTVNLRHRIRNVHKIQLKSVVLPVVIYNIKSTCNSFRFTDSVASTYTVTLSDGAYDVNTMSSTLETLMNASGTGDVFDIKYNSSTYKFEIESNSGAFTIETQANSVYAKMGIETLPVTSSPSPTLQTIFSSPIVFGLPLWCYIESLALSNTHNDTPLFLSSNALEDVKHIIARLYLSENSGGIIFKDYQSTDHASSVESFNGFTLSHNIDVKLKFPNDQDFEVLSDWGAEFNVTYFWD